MLCTGTTLKIVDFGIAALRGEIHGIAGTLEYMAPEILLGQEPTEASDLYALGVMAYELLTGRFPFRHESVTQMLAERLGTISEPTLSEHIVALLDAYRSSLTQRAQRHEVFANPEAASALAGPLGDVVRKLLEPDPRARYQDAAAVLSDLSDALGEPLPLETTATRESFLQSAQLVGRGSEIAVLSEALARALCGRGCGVLVGGESGVGKSRLLEEVRTLALEQGARVVRGQAIDSGGQAYQLWRDALPPLCLHPEVRDADAAVLMSLVPQLASWRVHSLPTVPMLEPRAAQTRLFEAVTSLLLSQQKPVVLLLEDLHWAEAESLALLHHVMGHIGNNPTLILGSYRDDEANSLPATLPTMQVLTLQRLDSESIAALTESVLGEAGRQQGLVALLERETEGNTLFLVEVMRALAEEAGGLDGVGKRTLPREVFAGGMKAVLQRRVSRVPAWARPLLTLAAVAGRQLDLHVLEHLEQRLEDWLHTCASAAVLEVIEGRWRFVHDKLRQVLIMELGTEEKQRLHGQVAAAMETVYAGSAADAHAATLAYHFAQAGRGDQASAYALQAGDHAQRLCLLQEARRHYTSGLAMVATLPQHAAVKRRKIDLLLRLVQFSHLIDSASENLARMREVEALLTELGNGEEGLPEDRSRLAGTYLQIGRLHHYQNRHHEAMLYFQKVLPLAQACEDRNLTALTLGTLGTRLLMDGRVKEAEPFMSRAAALIGSQADPLERLRIWGRHGTLLMALGRGPEAHPYLQQVVEDAKTLGSPSALSVAWSSWFWAAAFMGDWVKVCDCVQRTNQEAQHAGLNLYLYINSGFGAWAEVNLGRPERAIEQREWGRAMRKQLGSRLLFDDWFEAVDAMVELALGRPEAALALAQARVERSRDAGLFFSQGMSERTWGLALARKQRVAEAEQHLHNSLQIFEECQIRAEVAHTYLIWAQHAQALGDLKTARDYATRARDAYVRYGFESALRRAETLLAALPSG